MVLAEALIGCEGGSYYDGDNINQCPNLNDTQCSGQVTLLQILLNKTNNVSRFDFNRHGHN